ncbi:MAG: helix-turn-helix domain-containing protein [Kiritimatiellaeota bacterium]|nr:helix-turn-helix domain-containing protein [Kiritimatiellota bacterium]
MTETKKTRRKGRKTTVDDSPGRYMTVNDVARSLKLSKRTVRTLILRGVLPGVKIGRVYRVGVTDLQKVLQKSRIRRQKVALKK